MRLGWRLAAPSVLAFVSACGGGTTEAAAASPEALQQKMAVVQRQFESEQAVLDNNKASGLDIVSGGGLPFTGPGPTLFDVLGDPTILLGAAGDAAEATAAGTLTTAWTAHADAWCAQDPASWDDDFFLVYGGAHVLPALVAFVDTYCGDERAADLVAAATARGLGEGMAASGDPAAGIDLDALLADLEARG